MEKENWFDQLRRLTNLCYETWMEDDADKIATLLDAVRDVAGRTK